MVAKEQTKMSDLCWKVCDRTQSCCGSESLYKNYAIETFPLFICCVYVFFFLLDQGQKRGQCN